MRFEGTDTYIATPDLMLAVNAAIALRGSAPADPALEHAKLAAALVAGLVAWRTRSPVATLVAGMAVLWLAQWLLRAAA